MLSKLMNTDMIGVWWLLADWDGKHRHSSTQGWFWLPQSSDVRKSDFNEVKSFVVLYSRIRIQHLVAQKGKENERCMGMRRHEVMVAWQWRFEGGGGEVLSWCSRYFEGEENGDGVALAMWLGFGTRSWWWFKVVVVIRSRKKRDFKGLRSRDQARAKWTSQISKYRKQFKINSYYNQR